MVQMSRYHQPPFLSMWTGYPAQLTAPTSASPARSSWLPCSPCRLCPYPALQPTPRLPTMPRWTKRYTSIYTRVFLNYSVILNGKLGFMQSSTQNVASQSWYCIFSVQNLYFLTFARERICNGCLSYQNLFNKYISVNTSLKENPVK